MLKIPDNFIVKVERRDNGYVAYDGDGAGYGKTASEALRQYAEGLEVGTRINQRAALLNDDSKTPN